MRCADTLNLMAAVSTYRGTIPASECDFFHTYMDSVNAEVTFKVLIHGKTMPFFNRQRTIQLSFTETPLFFGALSILCEIFQ